MDTARDGVQRDRSSRAAHRESAFASFRLEKGVLGLRERRHLLQRYMTLFFRVMSKVFKAILFKVPTK